MPSTPTHFTELRHCTVPMKPFSSLSPRDGSPIRKCSLRGEGVGGGWGAKGCFGGLGGSAEKCLRWNLVAVNEGEAAAFSLKYCVNLWPAAEHAVVKSQHNNLISLFFDVFLKLFCHEVLFWCTNLLLNFPHSLQLIDLLLFP